MKTLFAIFGALVVFSAHGGEVVLAKEARAFLERPENEAGFTAIKKCERVGSAKKAKKMCTSSGALTAFSIVLAVKRDIDKTFTAVRVSGMGEKMCSSETAGFYTGCFLNSKGKTNGVNTHFMVSSEENVYKVYALRRVVQSPDGRKEVAYTPYSYGLDVASVHEAGQKYVEGVVVRALEELRRAKVMSLEHKDELVADRVPSALIHKLAVIEHIDETRFQEEMPQRLVNEVYAIYGLNQEIAYNYAVSSAKARGMFQIIPETYAGLLRKYPHAGLAKDFVSGTTDHVNAAKAAILLIDHDIGLLHPNIRAQVIADKKKYEEYAASSYNGGPSRAKKLLAKGADFVRNNVNRENRIFLSKLRLLFN